MGRRKQPLTMLRTLAPETITWPRNDKPPLDDAVERMAQSMERTGLRHPLLVVETRSNRGKSRTESAGENPSVRLVVGRKRLLAARQLAWTAVDCLVLPMDAAPQAEIVKKLQSEPVSPWPLAETLHTLKTRFGWTQDQLGQAIGKTRDFVANYLPLMNIQPEVRTFLDQADGASELTARHLRHIGRSPPARQFRIAQKIISEGTSTKSLEQENKGRSAPKRLLKVRRVPKTGSRLAPASSKDWRRLYRRLQTDLRRLERRERQEVEKSQKIIIQNRERLRALRSEAATQRRRLEKELRKVVRHLAHQ